MAVAHGNRTHRGRLSAPATGFEDRASHQIRKRYRGVLTLKLGQTDNIFWLWCRAGAIEMHEPGVGELVRAPLGDRDEEGGGRGDRPSLILAFLPLDLLIERVKKERFAQGCKAPQAPKEGTDASSSRHIPDAIGGRDYRRVSTRPGRSEVRRPASSTTFPFTTT